MSKVQVLNMNIQRLKSGSWYRWMQRFFNMKEIKLSYVLTTYNKLPYLKLVLERLIENCQEDEEIVVTDGASTDGTPAYLKQLFEQGKIHQYVSEKDCGEAHGFNKGFLLAKGELIKIMSDDDAFCYPVICRCKEFMLKNKQYDMLGGNMAYTDIKQPESIATKDDFDNFYAYKKDQTPFWFNGQPWMIRRSSLPLTGLLNTSLIIVDTEFSLRVTNNKKVKLCWLLNHVSVRIDNQDSNFNKFSKIIEGQTNRLFAFYKKEEEKRVEAPISTSSKLLMLFKSSLTYRLLAFTYRKAPKPTKLFVRETHAINTVPAAAYMPSYTYAEVYQMAEKWLFDQYDPDKFKILE